MDLDTEPTGTAACSAHPVDSSRRNSRLEGRDLSGLQLTRDEGLDHLAGAVRLGAGLARLTQRRESSRPSGRLGRIPSDR
jgi:hypothetical protein